MDSISIDREGRTINISADAPDWFLSGVRFIKTQNWPKETLIRFAGVLFAVSLAREGLDPEQVDFLQEFIEILLLYVGGYSISIFVSVSASGVATARGTASATVVST
jgi:hypothetical protein